MGGVSYICQFAAFTKEAHTVDREILPSLNFRVFIVCVLNFCHYQTSPHVCPYYSPAKIFRRWIFATLVTGENFLTMKISRSTVAASMALVHYFKRQSSACPAKSTSLLEEEICLVNKEVKYAVEHDTGWDFKQPNQYSPISIRKLFWVIYQIQFPPFFPAIQYATNYIKEFSVYKSWQSITMVHLALK